ncbi:MAG: S-methyl-5-thioribose-1-phosphate isomerase, partial [Burkholderiaceae bacterium]|nr:S-methyl-5-thioribose-1-phosphate isomerase [Burkholderiaceae bacterium]
SDVAEAIRTMAVRGAPLIGVAGAYGVALAMRADSGDDNLAQACSRLDASRPTAVNLRWALDRMRAVLAPLPVAQRADAAWREAQRIADEDVALNRAIGQHGATLIAGIHARTRRAVRVLTHCNAGWIATIDFGTALSAIYQAHDAGIPVHVWVDETRPRSQGLLTAWELAAHGVPHSLIVDNAGGHLMQRGEVDLVLVGADRVSARGDVANKIGTYLKALAAHDNGVPFYAAVPSPTIDWRIEDGLADVPIEERAASEVREVAGLDAAGQRVTVRIADESTPVSNPAFDVTPARLVTGIVTERGIAPPGELAALFPEHRRAA